MNTLQGQRIGFIGLGLMGKPMALNLAAAGAAMTVHNRSQGPVEASVREGMQAGRTPCDVASQTDTVILMLSDTPAVEKVLLDQPDGVVLGSSPARW